MNKEQWEKHMQDKPCYRPAPPFYDYCLNMEADVKRLDCLECVKDKGLYDHIE